IRPSKFMTTQTSITISGPTRQHHLVITPVNVLLPGGGRYATGEYMLAEGDVGIGTITINDSLEWTFDGDTDYNADQLNTIANFIIGHDKALLDDTAQRPTAVISESPDMFGFDLINHGATLQVQVLAHYPLYDIIIDGRQVAQLEQDHHNNWF